MLLPITALQPPKLTSIVIKQEKPKPKPVHYIIVAGDKLETIAQSQHTTVQRLYDKNTIISNPDVINVGETIEIPLNEEVLADRPMPVIVESSVQPVVISPPSGGYFNPRTSSPRTPIAGNLYAPGNCTYGVKLWRPDIPNNWGNANQWYYNAQAQGWATGVEPHVGAVAAARGYNHVALVIAVSGTQVTIKEMNGAGGLWAIDTRVTPVSEWNYIY